MKEVVNPAIVSKEFLRAVFAGIPREKEVPWKRIVVTPILVKGERRIRFEFFDGRKTNTQHHAPSDVDQVLEEILTAKFSGIHIETRHEVLDIRTSKKGRSAVSRKQRAVAVEPKFAAHNRVKEHPLPEGKADHLLEILGIMTADGSVKPTMRGKFRQINEFLKQLQHAYEKSPLATLGRPLRLLDCGCGASYLTLAAHHYFNDILGVPALVHGIDVGEEVIRKSLAKADKLETEGVRFTCAPITESAEEVDVVIALHACDTATDDALARAIRARATIVLSAPCCHHALQKQLQAPEPLRPLFADGILAERTADLVTDAFRATILRLFGYETDVVEFVDREHTARNLLLRGVRKKEPGIREQWIRYQEMKRFWNVTPYLEQALGADWDRLTNLPLAE